MKVLVTGANGFIGKNLCYALTQKGYEVLKYDLSTTETINSLIAQAEFIFHLAGINRPQNNDEFITGNVDLTKKIIDIVHDLNRNIPILLSSSIQADLNNDYGKSKKAAEDSLFEYGRKTGNDIFVYRLDNAFGKWCRPNYNSVVATFCHNIARDLPITIHNPNTELTLVYIDDIVNSFISCINRKGCFDYLKVSPSYRITLGEIAQMIYGFKETRSDFEIRNIADGIGKKLYATYLSYLPSDQFQYPLISHVDDRGSFTEFLKTQNQGQISVNISHPGIEKGNHWHHTKNEKFLVVKGEGLITFRNILNDDIVQYKVSGEKLTVIDIPVGYTHKIKNIGSEDLITIIWANEKFDKESPDTFFEAVEK